LPDQDRDENRKRENSVDRVLKITDDRDRDETADEIHLQPGNCET
jgi:hypothetical protein